MLRKVIVIRILIERKAPKRGVPIADAPIFVTNLLFTRDLDETATPIKQETSM